MPVSGLAVQLPEGPGHALPRQTLLHHRIVRDIGGVIKVDELVPAHLPENCECRSRQQRHDLPIASHVQIQDAECGTRNPATRNLPCKPRITHHASRITHHVSRHTLYSVNSAPSVAKWLPCFRYQRPCRRWCIAGRMSCGSKPYLCRTSGRANCSSGSPSAASARPTSRRSSTAP